MAANLLKVAVAKGNTVTTLELKELNRAQRAQWGTVQRQCSDFCRALNDAGLLSVVKRNSQGFNTYQVAADVTAIAPLRPYLVKDGERYYPVLAENPSRAKAVYYAKSLAKTSAYTDLRVELAK